MHTELMPKNSNIPDKTLYSQTVTALENRQKNTLHAVQYTWSQNTAELKLCWQTPQLRYSGTDCGFVQQIRGESKYYDYLLYLPEGYDGNRKWPVVYFFHGIDERGSDVSILLRHGMPKYLAEGGKINAIMISPQCPLESHWADSDTEVEEHLRFFLPEMAQKYAIDPDRVYITGLSMGGRCTWKLALAMPDQFAAMAVVCGRTNTYEFERLQDIPVWMIHGVQDSIVSFDNINKILPVLADKAHPDYRLTVYPHADHDVWTASYGHAELYDWMLSHRRKHG